LEAWADERAQEAMAWHDVVSQRRVRLEEVIERLGA
jgi:hypothetical protein